MGWLRIVRPGSVIGPQQQYLVEREAVMRRTGAQYRRGGPNVAVRAGDGAGAAARLIAEAERIVDGRLRAMRAPARRVSDIDDFQRPVTFKLGRDAPGAQVPPLQGRQRPGVCAAEHFDAGAAVPLRYCADLLPLPAVREAQAPPA